MVDGVAARRPLDCWRMGMDWVFPSIRTPAIMRALHPYPFANGIVPARQRLPQVNPASGQPAAGGPHAQVAPQPRWLLVLVRRASLFCAPGSAGVPPAWRPA